MFQSTVTYTEKGLANGVSHYQLKLVESSTGRTYYAESITPEGLQRKMLNWLYKPDSLKLLQENTDIHSIEREVDK